MSFYTRSNNRSIHENNASKFVIRFVKTNIMMYFWNSRFFISEFHIPKALLVCSIRISMLHCKYVVFKLQG